MRQKIKTNPSHFQKNEMQQKMDTVTYKNRICIPDDLETKVMKDNL